MTSRTVYIFHFSDDASRQISDITIDADQHNSLLQQA